MAYPGLGLDDTLVCDYGTDPSVDVVEFGTLRGDLRKQQLPPKCAIKLRFQDAIQFMKQWITDLRLRYPDKDMAPLTIGYDTAHAHVYHALSNYETPQFGTLSEPPQYGGLICSASRSDLKFLNGSILHMLYEEKYIKGYGRKGCTFWVFL
jgi:hypothetical protein